MSQKYIAIHILYIVSEVWELLREHNEPYCELYDFGFKRLGCVLCPFSSDIKREKLYFPKIAHLWELACDRLVAQHIASGYKSKRTGNDLKHHKHPKKLLQTKMR